VFNQFAAYRDKKVVGVFVRFRAPLQQLGKRKELAEAANHLT
jgi:hypothetical protein